LIYKIEIGTHISIIYYTTTITRRNDCQYSYVNCGNECGQSFFRNPVSCYSGRPLVHAGFPAASISRRPAGWQTAALICMDMAPRPRVNRKHFLNTADGVDDRVTNVEQMVRARPLTLTLAAQPSAAARSSAADSCKQQCVRGLSRERPWVARIFRNATTAQNHPARGSVASAVPRQTSAWRNRRDPRVRIVDDGRQQLAAEQLPARQPRTVRVPVPREPESERPSVPLKLKLRLHLSIGPRRNCSGARASLKPREHTMSPVSREPFALALVAL